MYAQRMVIPVTTAADGSATVYTPENVFGRVMAIHYVKDGTTPFSDGVGMTVTGEATGESIVAVTNMNASAHYYPRAQVCDTSAALIAYAAAGQKVAEPVMLANDRVKIVIASGGATKLGSIHVVIG